MEVLIVMYAHPAVWIEAADKRVVCEFPSAWPGEEHLDFEGRKTLAYQVKAALTRPPLQPKCVNCGYEIKGPKQDCIALTGFNTWCKPEA